MWWRVAAGAAAGLAIGSIAPPGEGLWVAAGAALGYAAGALHRWLKRRPKQDH